MTTALRTSSINWNTFLASVDEPPEGPIVFKDDPIAMACASYRLGQQGGSAWLNLHEVIVESQDRATATDIRKYYADRLLVTVLKSSGVMSEFRRKLYGVVTGNYQLKKSEEGLLYRLPYFYAEDTGLDYVMSQTQSASIASIESSKIMAGKFTLVKKIFCSHAAARSHWQFWFVRDISAVPYMVEIKDDNVLYKLFDTLTQQPQRFSAVTQVKHHRGHYRDRVYIRMTQVNLA